MSVLVNSRTLAGTDTNIQPYIWNAKALLWDPDLYSLCSLIARTAVW